MHGEMSGGRQSRRDLDPIPCGRIHYQVGPVRSQIRSALVDETVRSSFPRLWSYSTRRQPSTEMRSDGALATNTGNAVNNPVEFTQHFSSQNDRFQRSRSSWCNWVGLPTNHRTHHLEIDSDRFSDTALRTLQEADFEDEGRKIGCVFVCLFVF